MKDFTRAEAINKRHKENCILRKEEPWQNKTTDVRKYGLSGLKDRQTQNW